MRYVDGVTFYARDVKDGGGVWKSINDYMSNVNPATAFSNYEGKEVPTKNNNRESNCITKEMFVDARIPYHTTTRF